MFRVYEGGAYTNYVCDANGNAAFGVGSTSSTTTRAEFVAALSRELNVVTTLKQAIYLRLSKTNGTATFYNLTTGEFAGYISTQNYLLTAQDAENYLSILRQENGSIRQIWNLWDGLADIVPSETGYTISLYLPGQVTGNDPSTGLYTFTGDPFKTFAVGGDPVAKILTVVERDLTLPDGMPPYVTTWMEMQGIWNITEGTGEEAVTTNREKTDLPEEGTYRVVTTISKGGVPASIVAEEYLSHVTGELLLSTTEGYGSPDAQTTIYEYDDAGRMIGVIAPDGSETRYIHDAKGRITVTTMPWAGGKSQLIQTSYLDDGSEYSNAPAQVDTNFLTPEGIPQLHLRETYTYRTANHIKRVEKRSTANGTTRLEVTETWQGSAENVHARGRTRMTQGADGVQTWYDYAAATDHGALYNVTAETRVEGAAVPGQSTRNVSYITTEGNTIREERHILDSAGTWRLLAAADYEFDEQNRWTRRTRSNGRITTRAYMCSGDLLSETDENGVTTTYGYDSARQLVEVIRSAVTDGETVITPETITSYTRDAQGHVLQTRTDTGAMTTVESTEYDLLGRIISQTDALGRTTTYAYSADGLTTTVTTPSGATLVTRRHPDGSVLEENGTGQRHLIYQTDSVSDGIRQTVLIPALQEGEADIIVSRQITDVFGQGIRTAQATTEADTFIYDRQTYSARGLLTRSERDNGTSSAALVMAPTLYAYDSFGNVVKETWKLANSPTLANSRITTYAYSVEARADGVYRITTTTKNNGQGTTYTESVATLLSESATIEQKTIATDPRGNTATTWTEYGTGAQRTQKNSIPTSNITATVIDGFATAQTDHAGVTTTQTRAFTATGITLTQTDGRGNATTTKTDIAGRTISVTDAAGNTTTTAYCPCCDNLATVTDALGNTVHSKYDVRGRKTAEWGSAIQPALFAYDDADRMTGLTTFRADAGDITTDPSERTDGDTTTWQYHDATGLLLRKTYADGTHENSAYNGLNMLTSKTDPRGVTATYAWNTKKGVNNAITYSDGTPGVQYTYNHLNMVYRVTDASGTRNITYNIYCEKETDKIGLGGNDYLITEGYDAFGRGSGYTLKKGGTIIHRATQGYGADDRLASAGFILDGEKRSFGYGYLENSHLLLSLTMPNGIIMTKEYEDHRDLTAAMNYRLGETSVAQRSYGYDALARPVTRTITRQGSTRNDAFTYNERSELAAATLGTDGYSYGYDNIGNRKTAQELAEELTYASNSLNQYASIARSTLNSSPSTLEAPFVPTYDANGNQTRVKTATGLWTTHYDANNRPVRFEKTEGGSTTIVECGYDYMGRRYMKKVTVNGTVTLHHRYLYRGYLQIAALDMLHNQDVLHTILWDPAEPVATRPLALQKDSTWYTYGLDLTKNVWELCDHDGTICVTYDYAPYGEATANGNVTQPLQWSSEMYDAELAMVYYNDRYYDPAQGRWLSRDFLGENGLTENSEDDEDINFSQIANLYAFGPNNPIDGYDVNAENWVRLVQAIWNLLRNAARGAPKSKPPAPKPPSSKPKPKQEHKEKPNKNFGDCTATEHAVLNKAVGTACKGPKFSCNRKKYPNLSCDEIKLRITRATACVTARVAINKKCFKGGDATHRQEEEKAKTALKECTARHLAECHNKNE
ncbi:RHS repeat-associated core domain-containing protein [Akkermansia sp.]|uniref:RHS repeat-associated core domain-containing protein n=3 Tax=Akkermansia sp. TaxID=1872421 RepID=UPI002672024E|nr:RHS repeat-associated core domain-containing protein [Akkermansia sp.]MEE0765782.1 RHS repeat-associated core domain-containing protein [Akkermansia sp.]